MKVQVVENLPIRVTGTIVKTVALRDTPYVSVANPKVFVDALKKAGVAADLFTFTQEIADTEPRYDFHQELERLAVLPVSTYEHWLKHQIDFRIRNKGRKAYKCGVELKRVELDDKFIGGVVEIYNESPIRQGKPFWHYGKSFEVIEREICVLNERSEFVGAYLGAELIGFIKFVKGNNVASLIHIISKLSHRDKAPTNALLAKGVELCAERGISNLHYGVWSRRGLGVFKIAHGFKEHRVPRYFLPLNLKGSLLLRLRMHRRFREYLPEALIDNLAPLRARINSLRFRRAMPRATVR